MSFIMGSKSIVIFLIYLTSLKTLASNTNPDTNYTEDEKKALLKFHDLVARTVYHDYQKQDSYLIHFLRAKNLDLHSAKVMLENAVQWRKKNGIDSILEDKEMIQMEKYFPITDEGYDRNGSPLVVLHFGSWDIRRAMLAGKGSKLTRYIDYYFEKMSTKIRHLANSTQSDITQWVLIIDMQGYSLRQHACLICLPFYYDLISDYENYYPQKAKYIIILNASRLVDPLIKILNPLLAPYTQNTLKVHGYDKNEWIRELGKILELNQLPVALGGKNGSVKKRRRT